MFYIAEEVREYMAALGFKTWAEMIGRRWVVSSRVFVLLDGI
jgi:glutamate synthase domain-containing protein 2